MQQAELLAQRLSAVSINAAYSSDLARAKETTSIIANVIGRSVEYNKLLRERCYGCFEGKPIPEYEAALHLLPPVLVKS